MLYKVQEKGRRFIEHRRRDNALHWSQCEPARVKALVRARQCGLSPEGKVLLPGVTPLIAFCNQDACDSATGAGELEVPTANALGCGWAPGCSRCHPWPAPAQR